jgi:hypothetical protein
VGQVGDVGPSASQPPADLIREQTGPGHQRVNHDLQGMLLRAVVVLPAALMTGQTVDL